MQDRTKWVGVRLEPSGSVYYRERLSLIRYVRRSEIRVGAGPDGGVAMAGIAVVAMGYSERRPVDVPTLAGSVRAFMADGWSVVVSTTGPAARTITLGLGQSRAGRRAVPIVTHTLVDPADPAFADPAGSLSPEPLAVLEAEAIAALAGSGFPVVTAVGHPVVPFGDDYKAGAVALDTAADAQRLAGDLGASALVFVVGDDEPLATADSPSGEIDVIEADSRLAHDPGLAPELRAAARFLRAGGELAVITRPASLRVALQGPADGIGLLHIRRRLDRPRSEAPVLAAGWC